MVYNVLYAEVCLMGVLILTILSLKARTSMFLQVERKIFVLVAISNSLMFFLDTLWVFIEGNVFLVSQNMNWLLNSCYFLLSGLASYIWFVFSETVQQSIWIKSKKQLCMASIPMLILAITTLANPYTHQLFFITADNHYQRGEYYGLQLVLTYGYLLFTAGKAYILSWLTESYHKRNMYRALSTFILPPIVAGGIQVIWPGYPVLCIGITISVLYVYLTLQEQLIMVDALTKVNNRNSLLQHLSNKISHWNGKRNLYLMIMDIDYFKSINDTYGHVEGDNALKAVSESLVRVCNGKDFFVSRYGGDEFVVVCDMPLEDSIKQIKDDIARELTKLKLSYKLTMSVGYAKYTDEIVSQSEFMVLADKELYKEKKNRRSHQ